MNKPETRSAKGGNVRYPHNTRSTKRLNTKQVFTIMVGACLSLAAGLIGSVLITSTTASASDQATTYVRHLTDALLAADSRPAFDKLVADAKAPAGGFKLAVTAPVSWPAIDPGRHAPVGLPKPGRFSVSISWTSGANLYACDAETKTCLDSVTESGTTISKLEALSGSGLITAPR